MIIHLDIQAPTLLDSWFEAFHEDLIGPYETCVGFRDQKKKQFIRSKVLNFHSLNNPSKVFEKTCFLRRTKQFCW